jgi:NTE family protein
MIFGVNWTFERESVGDYQTGYLKPAPAWPVARAVAASSCFPPVFSPMPIGIKPEQLLDGAFPQGMQRNRLITRLGLSDGGVYDNMGLEPVWKDHRMLFISDGGATFKFEMTQGPIGKLSRYTAVISNQASGIRKRWLISNFINEAMTGAYWGIGSATERYGPGSPQAYSKPLAAEVIARVRTDLDAFSEGEMKVLENHGYLLAEAAIRRHLATLAAPDSLVLEVPHPDWMDEALVRRTLKDSHKRSIIGRR